MILGYDKGFLALMDVLLASADKRLDAKVAEIKTRPRTGASGSVRYLEYQRVKNTPQGDYEDPI